MKGKKFDKLTAAALSCVLAMLVVFTTLISCLFGFAANAYRWETWIPEYPMPPLHGMMPRVVTQRTTDGRGRYAAVRAGTDVFRRNELISASFALFDYFDFKAGTSFYFIDGLQPQSDGRCVYAPVDATDAEIAQAAVSLRYGKDAHAGLAYGLGRLVCRELGLATEPLAGESEVLSVWREQPLHEQSLALLSTAFSEKRTQKCARTLAARFAEWLGKERTEELLALSVSDFTAFENKYVALMLQFAGRSGKVLAPFALPRWKEYYCGYSLVCENERAAFYLREYVEGERVSPDMTTYADLTGFLNDSLAAMDGIEGFFETGGMPQTVFYLDPELLELEAERLYGEGNNIGGISYGSFSVGLHVSVFAHEYAHNAGYTGRGPWRLENTTGNGWVLEAMAEYLAVQYGSSYFTWLTNRSEVSDLLNRYPSSSPQDVCDVTAYYSQKNGFGTIQWGAVGNIMLSPEVAASFLNDLVVRYSKQTVLEFACSQKKEEEVFGKSFETLFAEWWESLKAKYEE